MRNHHQVRRVITINMPLGGVVFVTLATGLLVVAGYFTVFITDTVSMAFSATMCAICLVVVRQARRTVRNFRHEAAEKLDNMALLPTEDPSIPIAGEVMTDAAGSVTRLSIRRPQDHRATGTAP